MEFRLLRADEIDVRVKSVGANSVMLLLYKDARCDQNILDETVGAMNWQRHHSRDNRNCIVSIWDSEKQMWIEKEDTGTESNTEAEKGLASDSFKRACFNWSIGRELYSAPNLWFPKDKCKKIDGNKCGDYFIVESIEYTNRKISKVVIKNTSSGQTYTATNFVAPLGEVKNDEPNKNDMRISKVKANAMLKRLQDADPEKLKAVNISMNTIKAKYKVNSIEELTETQHTELSMILTKEGC